MNARIAKKWLNKWEIDIFPGLWQFEESLSKKHLHLYRKALSYWSKTCVIRYKAWQAKKLNVPDFQGFVLQGKW